MNETKVGCPWCSDLPFWKLSYFELWHRFLYVDWCVRTVTIGRKSQWGRFTWYDLLYNELWPPLKRALSRLIDNRWKQAKVHCGERKTKGMLSHEHWMHNGQNSWCFQRHFRNAIKTIWLAQKLLMLVYIENLECSLPWKMRFNAFYDQFDEWWKDQLRTILCVKNHMHSSNVFRHFKPSYTQCTLFFLKPCLEQIL